MGPDTEANPRSLTRLPRGWLVAAAVIPLVLIVVFGLLLAARLGILHEGVELGDPAPPIVLADLSGNPWRLADHAGQPVIVYFWGTWCPSCLDEFALLQSALDDPADAGLAVVGIVVRDRSEAVAAFIAQTGANWPSAMDPGEAVAGAYGIYGAPEAFFIDGSGTVRARQIGPLTADDLQEHLATILPAD
jgi:cytochrome c biogenesis protein CcmG/thiol:disulfide interchange protein DsbE